MPARFPSLTVSMGVRSIEDSYGITRDMVVYFVAYKGLTLYESVSKDPGAVYLHDHLINDWIKPNFRQELRGEVDDYFVFLLKGNVIQNFLSTLQNSLDKFVANGEQRGQANIDLYNIYQDHPNGPVQCGSAVRLINPNKPESENTGKGLSVSQLLNNAELAAEEFVKLRDCKVQSKFPTLKLYMQL